MLESLKASPKTVVQRAKYVFATDGNFFEAEKLSGLHEPVADELKNLANHFGFFLELAGISTLREIEDNPIDVRATGRIFCFFAEHTDIFNGRGLFTDTIEQISETWQQHAGLPGVLCTSE